MASIELDIIKQRTDRLTPAEKRELMDYLAASLAEEENRQDSDAVNMTGNEIKAA